jgi:hypothetical protein
MDAAVPTSALARASTPTTCDHRHHWRRAPTTRSTIATVADHRHRDRGRPLHELDLPTARWLISSVGLAAVEETTASLDAAEHLDTGRAASRRAELDLASRARDRWPEPGRAPAIVAAAIARRRARAAWPDADRLLFTRTGLEQASDPAVSAWRARRFAVAGEAAWDLAAGIGGDTLALAAVTCPVRAIDLNPARLLLLAHNAAVRGLAVETETADALVVRAPAGVRLHADPGRRRPDGSRVTRLRDHHPPVGALVTAHAMARGLAVVLSPAVDLDDPDLPPAAELEFVAVGDRLVEAVAWLGDLAVPGRAATATILAPRPGSRHAPSPSGPLPADARPADPPPPDGRRSGEAPSGVVDRSSRPAGSVDAAGHVSIARERGSRVELPVGEVGDHLLEVAAPAIRARLHDAVGAGVGARRLAHGRALLTTDGEPPRSPWYVARPILAVLPARPKAVRAWLRGRDAPELELVTHGVDADVAAWWRGLGRPPRGPSGWRLELVRLDTGAAAIVTGPAMGA